MSSGQAKKRIGAIFVDGSNVISHLDRIGGPEGGGRIDWGRLAEALEREAGSVSFRYRSYYGSYQTSTELHLRKPFTDLIKSQGYHVHLYPSKVYRDGSMREKQVDLALALDAYALVLKKQIEVLAIVSHDSDFVALVDRLPATVEAIIIGFHDGMANELLRARAKRVWLDDLWREISHRGGMAV